MIDGSYRFSLGQPAGDPPCKNGVHIIAVTVTGQNAGLIGSGVTLATAINHEPPQIEPAVNRGDG